MNMYRRKVHCQYCHSEGHNQRTCLKLREDQARNPNNIWLKDRVDRHSGSVDRNCRYCGNSGHNRQTCTKLKDDRFGAIIKNAGFRKETLRKFNELGIGLGTMFELSEPRWGATDIHLLMIDEIKWDEIIYQNADRALMVNNHGETDEHHSFTVNDHFWQLLKEGTLKIVVPTGAEYIGVGIPDGWEKGLSNMKKAFADWE